MERQNINHNDSNISSTRVLVNGVMVELSLNPIASVHMALGTHRNGNSVHIVNLSQRVLRCDFIVDRVSLRRSTTLCFGAVARHAIEEHEWERTTTTTRDQEHGLEPTATSTSMTIIFSDPTPALNKTEVEFRSAMKKRLTTASVGVASAVKNDGDSIATASSKLGAVSVATLLTNSRCRIPEHARQMVTCLPEFNAFQSANGDWLCVLNKRAATTAGPSLPSSTPPPNFIVDPNALLLIPKTKQQQKEWSATNNISSSSSIDNTQKKTEEASHCKDDVIRNVLQQLPMKSSRLDSALRLDISEIAKRAASGEAMWRQCAASFSNMMRHLQRSNESFCWRADATGRTIIASKRPEAVRSQ